MVFVGPEAPRWRPSTEADIRQAVDDGLLEESHSFDAKRQLAPGPSGNKSLAQDLAAMSLDGGFLLIGLEEDEAAGTFTLAPQPTAGVPERIENIATSAIDPPLYIEVTRIPAKQPGEDGKPRGYLLVEIPPSVRAPHQVNGVYYGRGDKKNRRLSDAEVQRLHAARASLTGRGRALLAEEIARDPIPRDKRQGGHLYLVAQPLSAAPNAATGFLRQPGIQEWIMNTTVFTDAPALTSEDRRDFQVLGHIERRSDGWANTSQMVAGTGRRWTEAGPQVWPDAHLLDIEFRNDGGIRAVVGQGTVTYQSQRTWVMDRRIVAFTRRLVLWTAEFGEEIGYRGTWLLGIHADGLAGLRSVAYSGPDEGHYYTPPRPNAPTYSPPVYSSATYEATTTESTQAIIGEPGAVTARLIEDLVWSLGTADRYADLFEATVT